MATPNAPNILVGISFPFRKQNSGQPAADYGADCIRSDLIALLRLRKRTVVMRPDDGTNLLQMIFEDDGPIIESLITRELVTVIASQMPVVSVLNIDLQTNPSNPKEKLVNVKYIVQGIVDETGFVPLGRNG